MNGREDWGKFAIENGLTWEEGPPKYLDQYGTEYLTLISDSFSLPEEILKVLGKDKHVVIRMFPHSAQSRYGLVRIRFSSYPEKPKGGEK